MLVDPSKKSFIKSMEKTNIIVDKPVNNSEIG